MLCLGVTVDRPIPTFGLGTWENTDPEQCARSVETALEVGYRHIDTAQVYGNEAAVGRGLAAADVPREEVFLATKVWTDKLGPEDVVAATTASLDRLGVEYVDLLYVHWPAGDYDPEPTLSAFETVRERGLTRHIGVSNFEPAQLDRARAVLDVPIVAHQIELHPLLPQQALRAYAARADHTIVAYSPLARGAILDHEVITAVADDLGWTPAQVSLAWVAQTGAVPIPKATGRAHIEENLAAATKGLPPAAHSRIEEIETRRRLVDPAFAPW